MKLYLSGHEYRYAVEQILLTMFPEERPVYPERREPGDGAVVSLHTGPVYTTAFAGIRYGGKYAKAFSRCRTDNLGGKLQRDRELQKIIKFAFYRAAYEITGKKPVWGALTGIRPAKMIGTLGEKGLSEEQAARTLTREYFVAPERATLCLDAYQAGERVRRTLDRRDAALYVGIPFCPTRCAYCSFVSQTVERSMGLIEPFLAALYREIVETAAVAKRLRLRIISVYIGGGTPTTLSAPQLTDLIGRLRAAFSLSDGVEFTVEAGRPDTITAEKLAALREGGVTRISINPQSMDDRVLEAIGRKHSAEDVRRACRLARDAGSGAVNMDLIAGLPADSAKGFQRTLDEVIGYRPENITVHTLALKKGSRILLEGTALPSAEEVGRMLDFAAAGLRQAGYRPYYLYRQKFMSGGFENVGWALPGTENLYNILIMEELCTILAMGGGGSTKLVAAETGKIERIFNAKYPLEYLENEEKRTASKEHIAEFYEAEILRKQM